jgi:hydrogenase maturation factor
MVDKKEAGELVDVFKRKGISSSICGEVVSKKQGLKIKSGGMERTLEHPKVDPYWTIAAELAK